MIEITKDKKGIHLNSISKTVWEDFKNMTRNKHGKIHSVLGQEVEKALIFYMKHDTNNTHIEQTQIKKISKKEQNKKISKKEQNFTKVAKELFKFYTIPHKILKNIILKTGVSDDRVIKSYINSFIAMQWISKITEIGHIRKVYKIDHTMINITLAQYENEYKITFDF